MSTPENAKEEFSQVQIDAMLAEVRARLDENDVLASLIKEIALCRLTTARSEQNCARLEREVRILRAKLQLRDVLLPEARVQMAGATAVKVDAASVFPLHQGFYALEYDSLGHPYRWTGPGNEFFLNFNLDRTIPLSFSVRFSKVTPEDVFKSLRCFVDQNEVPLECEGDSADWVASGIAFPRETLGPTRFDFLVSKVFRPKDADPYTSDDRELGVVFVDMVITPASPECVRDYLRQVDFAERPEEARPSAEGEATVATVLAIKPVKDEPDASTDLPADAEDEIVLDMDDESIDKPAQDRGLSRIRSKPRSRRGGGQR